MGYWGKPELPTDDVSVVNLGDRFVGKLGNVFTVKALYEDRNGKERAVLEGEYTTIPEVDELLEIDGVYKRYIEKFEVGHRYEYIGGDSRAAEFYDIVYTNGEFTWFVYPLGEDGVDAGFDHGRWYKKDRAKFKDIGKWAEL